MLIWKFFRMVWTTHAEVVAPVPHWTIPPERFIGLHPRLTDLTPRMIQTLGQGTKITTINIMDTTTDKIKSRWIHLNRTIPQTRRRLDWHAAYTQSLALYML